MMCNFASQRSCGSMAGRAAVLVADEDFDRLPARPIPPSAPDYDIAVRAVTDQLQLRAYR